MESILIESKLSRSKTNVYVHFCLRMANWFIHLKNMSMINITNYVFTFIVKLKNVTYICRSAVKQSVNIYFL